MREDICTIPINDIFSPKSGCPICRMRDMLEDRIATYITGAAMMEPGVREETNRQGFCKTHFDHILARGSRLSVALILESLLASVELDSFSGKKPLKNQMVEVHRRHETCFICENIETNMKNLTINMIRLWEKEAEFRSLYSAQPYICFEHIAPTLKIAKKAQVKKNFNIFSELTMELASKQIVELQKDVTHFCRMFDYRNANEDWGDSKDAIERAIKYLTSRSPEIHPKAEEKNR